MDEDELSNVYKEIVSELLGKTCYEKSRIMVNNHYFYCSNCKNHYYTQSNANDINSFFQNHINTSYHKSKLLAEGYPDNHVTIKWEKWLYSGCCDLCDVKDIEAYFISKKFHLNTLAGQHHCEKFVEKDSELFDVCLLDKLKWFFASKVFSKKFLRERDQFVECGLCSKKFLGDVKKNRYHLYSDRHFSILIGSIRKKFGFSTLQILSAFNLEKVVKWLLDVNVVFKCKDPELVDESNIRTAKNKNDFEGFSPKEMKRIVKKFSDYIISDHVCSICNKPAFEEFHFFDHWEVVRSLHLEENSQVNLTCLKVQLKMYMTLVNYLMRHGLYIGAPYSPEFDTVCITVRDQIVTIKNDSIHSLMKKKMESYVGMANQTGSGRFFFCEICEISFSFKLINDHFLSEHHFKNCQKFGYFLENFVTFNYLEPLQTISNVMCCLICGVLLNTKTLFNHMQLQTHINNYEKYKKIQKIRPVSESFVISMNSCHCVHCGDLMIFSNFSSLVKQISKHWPCCDLEFQKTASHMMRLLKNRKVRNFNEENSGTHSNSDEIDFKTFEKNVEKLFSLCEKDVSKKVTQKVRLVLPKLNLNNRKMKIKPSKGSKSDPVAEISRELENLKVVKKETFISRSNVVNNDSGEGLENNKEENKVKDDVGNGEELESNEEDKVDDDGNGEEIESNKGHKVEDVDGNGEELESNEEEDKVDDEGSGEESESDKEENKVEDDEDDDDQDYEDDIYAQIEMELQTEENQQKRALSEREPKNKEYEAVEILFNIRPTRREWKAIAKNQTFASASFFFLEDNKLVFAFKKEGIAEGIASSGFLDINKKRYNVVFTTRKLAGNPKARMKNLREEMVFLLENPSELVKKMESLVSECLQSNNVGEKLRENSVSDVIQEHLAKTFSFTRVYIFGSRMTGLSSSNSDVDIFLDYGNNFFGFDSTKSNSLVDFLGNSLRKDKRCSRVTMVRNARVPIVSFFHKPSQLMCDVSFKNALSVYKTKLIQFFLALDYRVKPLLLFVKHWAKSNNLHGSPKFTSYGLSLLLVFYLQQLPSPILPPVEVLEKNFTGCRKTISGWDYEFNTDEVLLPPRSNKSSLVELLLGFFEFYASFDYQKYVICPLTGTSIKKSAFCSSPVAVAELPDILLKNIVSLPFDFNTWVDRNFCVMDPLELDHIVTKSIKKLDLSLFKLLCKKSVLHLKKGLNTTVKNIDG